MHQKNPGRYHETSQKVAVEDVARVVNTEINPGKRDDEDVENAHGQEAGVAAQGGTKEKEVDAWPEGWLYRPP